MSTERDLNEDVTGAQASDDRNLGALGDPAHPFDQTNGIVDGLEGEPENDEQDATGNPEDGPVIPPGGLAR